MEQLTEEEKYRVALQVDHFIEIVEKRSGVTFSEVVTLVLWAREHKAMVGKVQFYAGLSILGMALSGLAYGLLEGIKHVFSGGGK
jgi:hypothetical protein